MELCCYDGFYCGRPNEEALAQFKKTFHEKGRARTALSAAIESQDITAISIIITVHWFSPASEPAPKFFRPADQSSYKLSFVFTVEISALRLPLTHGKTYLLWKQQIKQSGAKTINRLLQKLPEALDLSSGHWLGFRAHGSGNVIRHRSVWCLRRQIFARALSRATTRSTGDTLKYSCGQGRPKKASKAFMAGSDKIVHAQSLHPVHLVEAVDCPYMKHVI